MTALLIFWIGTFFAIPTGVWLCRLWKGFVYIFFILMIFSLCLPEWSITLLSKDDYKVATRGFEIHLIDIILAVFVIYILMKNSIFRINFTPPFTVLILVYLGFGLISWMNVEMWKMPTTRLDKVEGGLIYTGLLPLFQLSKILRGFVAMWVSYHLFQDARIRRVFLFTLSACVLYFTLGGLWARYIMGFHRVTVGQFHYNDYNTLVGMMGLLIYPWSYSTKSSTKCAYIWFITCCALLCIILSISRSSFAGYVMGGFVATLFILPRYFSPRNICYIILAGVVSIAICIKAADSLMTRFNDKRNSRDFNERAAINDNARLMGLDHPLTGVGLGNNYAYTIEKYAARTKQGVEIISHNIWYSVFSELGFPGLIIFLAIWIRFYQMIFFNIFTEVQLKDRMYLALLLGVLAASILLQFQNCYHFTYRHTSVFYLTSIMMGMLGNLTVERRRALYRHKLAIRQNRLLAD